MSCQILIAEVSATVEAFVSALLEHSSAAGEVQSQLDRATERLESLSRTLHDMEPAERASLAAPLARLHNRVMLLNVMLELAHSFTQARLARHGNHLGYGRHKAARLADLPQNELARDGWAD